MHEIARAVARIALGLTASVLVALLLCEAFGRIYERIRCVPQNGAINRFDPRYGWGNRPGVRARMTGCLGPQVEYRVDVTTNALGLRGPAPTPGTRRVLVLGDSFTARHAGRGP